MKKRQIPEKFRVSIDPTDEEAFARLQEVDEKQIEWRARTDVSFASQTPKERERANAVILIETLSKVHRTIEQDEQLAEAYASLGHYDVAEALTKDEDKNTHFKAYWDAIYKEDGEFCEHAGSHDFIKDNIYSLKHGKEITLIGCNVPSCDALNAMDAPERLLVARRQRAQIRTETKGMSMPQKKAHLSTHYKGIR